MTRFIGIDLATGRDYSVTLGGIVKEWHEESQRVWYKPWTWFQKRLKIVDELELDHASIGPKEPEGSN